MSRRRRDPDEEVARLAAEALFRRGRAVELERVAPGAWRVVELGPGVRTETVIK